MFKGVNWIGVIVATIAVWLVGYLWYDMLFAEPWLAAMGMTEADAQAGGMMPMVWGFLNTLVVCIGLGVFVPRFTDTLAGGATTGLLAGVFFASTTMAMGFIYGGKPQSLMHIDFGYLLLMYVLAGAIVGGLKLGRKTAAAAA